MASIALKHLPILILLPAMIWEMGRDRPYGLMSLGPLWLVILMYIALNIFRKILILYPHLRHLGRHSSMER
jgi:hypothetical protein